MTTEREKPIPILRVAVGSGFDRKQRLSAGVDENWDEEKVPMLLYVPDHTKARHYHIALTWEGARDLRDWLNERISEHDKV